MTITTSGGIVANSIIEGSLSTLSGGVATIGASRLDGGSVIASSATCAGVYDESLIFYASTCPLKARLIYVCARLAGRPAGLPRF